MLEYLVGRFERLVHGRRWGIFAEIHTWVVLVREAKSRDWRDYLRSGILYIRIRISSRLALCWCARGIYLTPRRLFGPFSFVQAAGSWLILCLSGYAGEMDVAGRTVLAWQAGFEQGLPRIYRARVDLGIVGRLTSRHLWLWDDGFRIVFYKKLCTLSHPGVSSGQRILNLSTFAGKLPCRYCRMITCTVP